MYKQRLHVKKNKKKVLNSIKLFSLFSTEYRDTLDRYWENQDQFYNYRAVITTGQDRLESDSEETELVQDCKRQMIAFYQNGRRGFVSITRLVYVARFSGAPSLSLI